jgi:hypothetical protein
VSRENRVFSFVETLPKLKRRTRRSNRKGEDVCQVRADVHTHRQDTPTYLVAMTRF